MACYNKAQDDLFSKMAIPSCLNSIKTSFSHYCPTYQEMYDRLVRDRLKDVEEAIDKAIFGGPSLIATTATNASSTADFSLESLKEVAKKFPKIQAPIRYVFRPNKLLGSFKQVRFPKSKKKRIRRKWAKWEANYSFVADPNVYIIENTITAHPDTLSRVYLALGLPARPTQSVELDLLGFQTDLLRELTGCP